MAQPRVPLVALLASLSAVVGAMLLPRATAAVDLRVYDLLLAPVPAPVTPTRVAVVAIDDASIAALGQWPWPRDVVGRLIDRLRSAGAAVIAVDVLFSESDRHPKDTPLDGSPDTRLAEAIGRGGVVLGYAFTFDTLRGASPSCAPEPLRATMVTGPGQRPPAERLFHAVQAVCSLPQLTANADGTGYLNVGIDADGTLRRLPLVMVRDGQLYPSLALAAVHLALAGPPMTLAAPASRPLTLTLGDRAIGLDERGALALRFRAAAQGFAHIPAIDVLNGSVAAGALDDRIVFIGATALGVRDAVVTPSHVQQPGIDVHATAAENLLAGTFVVTPPLHRAIESGLAILLAVLAALVVGRLGYRWTTAFVAMLLLGGWGASRWLLQIHSLYVSPVVPSLGLLASFAAVVMTGVAFERRRAEEEQRRRRQAHEFVVKSLTSLMEMRDASTGRHSRRTQGYSRLLAQRLAHMPEFQRYLTAERIESISLLAPLHDIGKIGIRDAVLNKPGPLTADELQEMRLHPVYGFETISKAQRQVGIDTGNDAAVLQIAKDIVYTHHEWWDGSGYPQGLFGADIPVAGRIVAVVDVYDALVEPRPYRRRLRHEEAVELIVAGRGTQFDPTVVKAFLTVALDFQELGTRLRETPAHRLS